jgi:SAM-dependent methyltransferase
MDKPADHEPRAAARTHEHALRAASFGPAASAYALHRPGYPPAAIDWALEPVSDLAGRPAEILDLGAGTGKLTAQLASRALHGLPPHVIAVEPDEEMLAELRRLLPDVTAVAGRAEAIPLPDGSVEAVLAGQSAHWFDLDLAMPEIYRVLIPGGVFAGLWNADDDRVGWVAGLHRASGRRNVVAFSSFAEADEERGLAAWLRGPGESLFSPPQEAGFEHGQVRTADSLIATMRTHSMFLVMERAERHAAFARVREYLAATPQTASGEFTLPIWTMAQRTIRRGYAPTRT